MTYRSDFVADNVVNELAGYSYTAPNGKIYPGQHGVEFDLDKNITHPRRWWGELNAETEAYKGLKGYPAKTADLSEQQLDDLVNYIDSRFGGNELWPEDLKKMILQNSQMGF